MRVRKSLLVILGLVLVLAAVGLFLVTRQSVPTNVTGAPSQSMSPAAERDRRTAAIIDVAPALLPTALPLVGDKDALGPDGYPVAYVDRPALRSLLWHRRFEDLTRYITEIEDAFDVNPRCEQWANDTAEAFATADPSIRELLDQWVSASTGSFAPLVARGVYATHVGLTRRGGKWAADTPEGDFRSMEEAFAEAKRDLEAAIAIRPRLTVAFRNLIRIAANTGARTEQRHLVERAAEACPTCFLPRGTFLVFSTPRWAGSYEAMTAFASAADHSSNPRLRWLQGYVDHDRADTARRNKDYPAAEAAIERALALGEYWLFLDQRSKLRADRGDNVGALADLDRAIVVRPDEPGLLFQRATLLAKVKRWEEAADPLLAGLRVDATGDWARLTYDNVLKGLDWQGWEYAKEGRRDDALRLYELAMDLAPSDRQLLQRRTFIDRIVAEPEQVLDHGVAALHIKGGLLIIQPEPPLDCLACAGKQHPGQLGMPRG